MFDYGAPVAATRGAGQVRLIVLARGQNNASVGSYDHAIALEQVCVSESQITADRLRRSFRSSRRVLVRLDSSQDLLPRSSIPSRSREVGQGRRKGGTDHGPRRRGRFARFPVLRQTPRMRRPPERGPPQPGTSCSRRTTLLRLSWPTIARPRPYFRGSRSQSRTCRMQSCPGSRTARCAVSSMASRMPHRAAVSLLSTWPAGSQHSRSPQRASCPVGEAALTGASLSQVSPALRGSRILPPRRRLTWTSTMLA